MSFGAKREYLKEIWGRYQKSTRNQKSLILDEFCEVTGLHRKYAIRILGAAVPQRVGRPGPKTIYDQAFVEVLYELWQVMRRMCSEKMVKAIPEWLRYFHSEKMTEEIRQKLLSVSASSIDRCLKSFRVRRGMSTTKPGKFLKSKIPLTIHQEGIKAPGYLQGDTVAHCDDDIRGKYAHSLTMTDVFSTWTENRAVWTKDSKAVMKEFLGVERELPFRILGWSSDNGGEVLNHRLVNYLDTKNVRITRSRAYKKNDNAHVEQKNNTHVRKIFGYDRIDAQFLVPLMNKIYRDYWNPLQNFFTPAMKTTNKRREGGRIIKTYDEPKTPYERLMDCPMISKENKLKLKQKKDSLNPIQLSKELDDHLRQFFKLLKTKRCYL